MAQHPTTNDAQGLSSEPTKPLFWMCRRRRFVRLPPMKFSDGRIENEFLMDIQLRKRSVPRSRRCLLLFVATACVLLPWIAAAQALTGALVGTVKDEQGAVLPGALVRVSSPALIGGPTATTTNERGQLRFPALPPGPYLLEIELQG